MNRRRQRTEQLRQATAQRRMAEQADNAIEQHRFNRLVRSGVIMQYESGTDTHELEYPDWAGREAQDDTR